VTAIAIVLLTFVLAWVEKKSDPVRFGAPGTFLALASGLALLATTLLAITMPDTTSPLRVLGVPFAAIGIALRGAAVRALGDAFSSETVLVPGRAVVTRGLYAHLRHPSDIGLLLFASGIAVLGGSAAALATVALALGPTIVLRIVREERLLRR
jgi:protein-S-isoprenylcysteine O-methyltransferase Ste14